MDALSFIFTAFTALLGVLNYWVILTNGFKQGLIFMSKN